MRLLPRHLKIIEAALTEIDIRSRNKGLGGLLPETAAILDKVRFDIMIGFHESDIYLLLDKWLENAPNPRYYAELKTGTDG